MIQLPMQCKFEVASKAPDSQTSISRGQNQHLEEKKKMSHGGKRWVGQQSYLMKEFIIVSQM